MSAPNVTVEGISRSFSGVQALDDVSLRLDHSEILGLIGPNGSGKSTLVNVISGALRPDAGRVLLNGVDVTGHPTHLLAQRGVARTFQTVRLFSSMTVRENIQVGVVSGDDRPGDIDAAVDELLDFADLRAWEHVEAVNIPYGLQRRVELARSLATRPAFLLLDEPAAGLNASESDELLGLIERIHADGTGVLVIDHDLRLILRLCQRVHVLVEGRSLVEGPPAEVRAHPGVVEAYIGAGRQTARPTDANNSHPHTQEEDPP